MIRHFARTEGRQRNTILEVLSIESGMEHCYDHEQLGYLLLCTLPRIFNEILAHNS